MRASFSNHTAAAQKGIKRPGLVFGTEEVAVAVTKESFSVFPLTLCSWMALLIFQSPFNVSVAFLLGTLAHTP